MFVKYEADKITSGLSRLLAEITRLEALAAGGVTKAKEVVDCRKVAHVAIPYADRITEPAFLSRLGAAIKEANEGLLLVESVHSKNIEAIVFNKDMIAKITEVMRGAGVGLTYETRETVRGRTKWVTKDAGFLADLRRSFPTQDFYEEAKRNLKDTLHQLSQKENDIAEEQRKSKEKRAYEQRIAILNFEARKLAEKYGLPSDEGFNAEKVLGKILEQDSNLRNYYENHEYEDEETHLELVDEDLRNEYWLISKLIIS